MLGALAKIALGSWRRPKGRARCGTFISVRPAPGAQAASGEALQSAEVLMFNSGGSGARASLDGLNATAFPSGVHAVSVEATEHTGPIIIWRKELREDLVAMDASGGGLGQVMEIGVRDGHQMHFNAMFDRIDHPASRALGRRRGSRGRGTAGRWHSHESQGPAASATGPAPGSGAAGGRRFRCTRGARRAREKEICRWDMCCGRVERARGIDS